LRRPGGDFMTELPSGTVTFLFTDIEGSTMRLKELGAERYSEVLERHNELLRALSPSERRVVAYAAEGFTVDEIAQSLFLTPATVEDYLARARRTLGVQTNDELARALTSPGSDASEVHVPV
jgi:DNA-binding NarL/FixJ family response regulator